MTMLRELYETCRGTIHSGLATAFGACALALLLAGCRTPLQMPSLGWNNDPAGRELANIDGIRGPLQRVLAAREQDRLNADRSLRPPEGLDEYDQARRLYDEGQLKVAEKQFKRLAKKYKDSSVGEDAQFMLGETQFARKKYPAAQDSYDRLLKDYPSTRHMGDVTQHMFDIAKVWLQAPNVVTSGDIQQVNLEAPTESMQPVIDQSKTRDPSRIVPIFPNMWDRQRPVFDTEGRALQALRSIWLNDPTGPLADDALMLSASHHLRKGHYEEADHIYTTIREEYGKSPHFENALVLGGHTRLMSYQGPLYENDKLLQARELRESALRMLPDNPMRKRMLEEVRAIEKEEARADWERVKYYQRRKEPKAVAVYCELLIEDHPNSEFAAQARQLLAQLRGEKIPQPAGQPPAQPAPLDETADDADAEGTLLDEPRRLPADEPLFDP